ncbi:hypothetical protein [Vibrio parahaemolyticus]|uniref:hypothetical protein n=1 Tax=Vibrio parahaemolyticus TaxID=670 RepID=UPI00387AA831
MVIKSFKHNGVTYTECSPEKLLASGVPQSVVDSAIAEQERKQIEEARRAAYLNESDPLFLEWQYDQTPEKEQAWRDKVAEIKARYPLSVEV